MSLYAQLTVHYATKNYHFTQTVAYYTHTNINKHTSNKTDNKISGEELTAVT
jgi:hypothetical protein